MFCRVMLTALVLTQAGADIGRGDDSFSQRQHAHMAVIKRLQQENLSTEDRKTIVTERVERLKASDDYLIYRALRVAFESDRRSLDHVLPKFAALIRQARTDQDKRGLCRVIDAVIQVRSAHPKLVDELAKVVSNAQEFTFASPRAAAALLAMQPKNEQWKTWLIGRLKSKQAIDRNVAVFVIQQAAAAGEFKSELKGLLKDPEANVRVTTASAQSVLDGPSEQLATVLQESLRHRPVSMTLQPTSLSQWSPNHHHSAISGLGKMGTRAKGAADEIAALLDGNEDEVVRMLAARALGSIGAATPKVLRTLGTATGDTNASVAAYAKESLKVLTNE